MVLPAPNLDDRTFQDIVDEAKRLIPRYTPEWTNHNVSDPGVALIELFAWMSEMVLYRVNQVPDRLFVHFLNLVGIEPFPPSVAKAQVTFWLSAVQDIPVTVPAGLQVTTTGDRADNAVVFSTVDELTIRPPVLVNALTSDAKGRTNDGRVRRPALRRSVGHLFHHHRRVGKSGSGQRSAARIRGVVARHGHPLSVDRSCAGYRRRST